MDTDLRKHERPCLPRGRCDRPGDGPKYAELLERHCRAAMEKHHELLEALTAFVVFHGLDPRELRLYQKETKSGYCWYFSHPSLEAQVSDAGGANPPR